MPKKIHPEEKGWGDIPSFSPPLEGEKPAEQEVVDFSKFPDLDQDMDIQFGAADMGGSGLAAPEPPPPPPAFQKMKFPAYIKAVADPNDPQQQPLTDPQPAPPPPPPDPPPAPPVEEPEIEQPIAPERGPGRGNDDDEEEKPEHPDRPGRPDRRPRPTPYTAEESVLPNRGKNYEKEEQQSAKSERRLMLEILNKVVENQNQYGVTNVQPVVAGSMNYEQMAIALLSVGCEQYMTAIREIAHNLTEDSIAAWLNALVSLHGDQGNLSDIAYNSDWQKTLRGQGPTVASGYLPAAIGTCEHCGHSFRPPLGGNIRQRFCCNVCGKKAAGYGDEPVPHSPDCTTEVGKQLRAALVAATPPTRVAA